MHRVRHRDRSCLRVKVLCSQALSQVRLFATPWTIALKAPWYLSMASSSQENWSGLPFPSPGDLPHLGVESVSLALKGGFFTIESSGKPTLSLTPKLNLKKGLGTLGASFTQPGK